MNAITIIVRFDSRSKRLQDTAIEHAENWRQRHATLIQEQNKWLRGMVPLGDVEGYSSDDDDSRVEEAVRGMGDGSCDEVADLQSGHSPKQESVAPSRATSARVSFKASEGDGAGAEDDRIWLEQTKEEVHKHTRMDLVTVGIWGRDLPVFLGTLVCSTDMALATPAPLGTMYVHCGCAINNR